MFKKYIETVDLRHPHPWRMRKNCMNERKAKIIDADGGIVASNMHPETAQEVVNRLSLIPRPSKMQP